MKPKDLPDPEKHPHGTRARYVGAKCRCTLCRAANTAYYHRLQKRRKTRALEIQMEGRSAENVRTSSDRQKVRLACPGVDGKPCKKSSYLRSDSTGGICRRCRDRLVWNGLVPARSARAHLIALSQQGVGYKAVAAASDVAETVVWKVLSQAKAQIRADTERRILEVDKDAISNHALVPGAPTWKAIKEMVALGITQAEIAERLGHHSHGIQIRKTQVLAKTELRVLKLLKEVREEATREKTTAVICRNCGLSHAMTNRRKTLARLLPADFKEVRDVWPCLYENTNTGYTRFMRDCKALGQWPKKRARDEIEKEREVEGGRSDHLPG